MRPRGKKAIDKGDAATAYRGLWATGYEDVDAAVKAATPLLKDKDAARRFAAVELVARERLPEAAQLLLPLLDDPDLRVLSSVLDFYNSRSNDDDDEKERRRTFRRICSSGSRGSSRSSRRSRRS